MHSEKVTCTQGSPCIGCEFQFTSKSNTRCANCEARGAYAEASAQADRHGVELITNWHKVKVVPYTGDKAYKMTVIEGAAYYGHKPPYDRKWPEEATQAIRRRLPPHYAAVHGTTEEEED